VEKQAYRSKSESQPRPRSTEELHYGDLSRQKDSEWKDKKSQNEEKREESQLDPYAEISTWHKWTKTDNYKECKRTLGWSDAQLVAPSVIDMITKRLVDDDVIELLFMEYPFLEGRCKSKKANPIQDLINTIQEGPHNKEEIVEKYTPKQYVSDFMKNSQSSVDNFSTDYEESSNTSEKAECINANLIFN
jgi:hypothetical protein